MATLAQKMIKNPLLEKLEGRKVILASGSPRRRKFFEDLGIPFEVRLRPINEIHPPHLKGAEIADYLAVLKSKPFKATLKPDEIVITSDTVVWCNDQSLAKASTKEEAKDMLQKLSGKWHKVITSVCFTTTLISTTVHSITEVRFRTLSEIEIDFYIETFKPYDKAGAYGIQDWLGAVAIDEIRGSYNNVVGLPTHLVYQTLMNL